MYWSKLTLFCNKNFISFSFFFLFRLDSTLLLHPTWYQTHPVVTWERHLLLIKHSLMASLFVCCIHSIFTYLFEKYCLVANKKRCVAFCKKKISQNLHDNFFSSTDVGKSGDKPKPIKFSEEENEESPDSSDDIPSSISKLKRRLLKCTPTRPPSVTLTEPRMTPVTQLQKTCTPRDVLLTGQEWHVWYRYSYDSQQIVCLTHAQAHKNSGHETSQPLVFYFIERNPPNLGVCVVYK